MKIGLDKVKLNGEKMDEQLRNKIQAIKNSDLIEDEGAYKLVCRKELSEKILQGQLINDEKPIFLSIIIPTYKRPGLLRETIESIVSQTTFEDYEILIVDNAGKQTDGIISDTEAVVREFQNERIVYYQNKKENPSVNNWNLCLALARGTWVCMVHDDDILLPGHLRQMSEIVKKNKSIDFVGCINYSFQKREDLEKVSIRKKGNVQRIAFEEFMYGMPVSLLGAFFKKDKAIQLGGFDGVSQMGDYVFVTKYAYKFGVFLYKHPLYGYRIGNGQDSANNEMNYIRRIADYYLWRAIAKRRKGLFHKLYMKNCQYNLQNRIREYNCDKKYGDNHFIDFEAVCKECDINSKLLHQWEYYLCKAVHVVNIVKNHLIW